MEKHTIPQKAVKQSHSLNGQQQTSSSLNLFAQPRDTQHAANKTLQNNRKNSKNKPTPANNMAPQKPFSITQNKTTISKIKALGKTIYNYTNTNNKSSAFYSAIPKKSQASVKKPKFAAFQATTNKLGIKKAKARAKQKLFNSTQAQ